MAQYEVVGLCDCPYLFKAEKLLEKVCSLFPKLYFTRRLKTPEKWEEFCGEMKKRRGWEITSSPVIYQILGDPELVDRVILIGHTNELCEYIQSHFGISTEIEETMKISLSDGAKFNKLLCEQGLHDDYITPGISLCHLSFINSPPKYLEIILGHILSNSSPIPSDVTFSIRIFDENTPLKALKGFLMEIRDLASKYLFKVEIAQTLEDAFTSSDFVVFLQDFSQNIQNSSNGDGDGNESITQWLGRVKSDCRRFGEGINKFAPHGCKILIGSNGPENLIAESLREVIAKDKVRLGKIITIGQYVSNQSKALISKKCGISPSEILQDLNVFGWPGSVGAYIDISDIEFQNKEKELMKKYSKWLFDGQFEQEFMTLQKQRLDKVPGVIYRPQMTQALSVVQILSVWIHSIRNSQRPNENFQHSRSLSLGSYVGSDSDDDILATLPKRKPKTGSNMGITIRSGDDTGNSSNGQSTEVSPRTPTPAADQKSAATGFQPAKTFPVISIGIECSNELVGILPEGTFVVQPCICKDNGTWHSIAQMSKKVEDKIKDKLKELWDLRVELVRNGRRIRSNDKDDEETTDAESESESGAEGESSASESETGDSESESETQTEDTDTTDDEK